MGSALPSNRHLDWDLFVDRDRSPDSGGLPGWRIEKGKAGRNARPGQVVAR